MKVAYMTKNDVVINTAVFEDDDDLPKGWKEAENGEQIGWIKKGKKFVAPPVPDMESSG